MARIRLAVVDDSHFIRKAIVRLLAEDPRIHIVGSAATGEELLENLDRWKPDVITMDLSMPGMGGLLTLDRLMERRRIPVIILSTHSSREAPETIEALGRGAVDFIDKQQYSLVDFEALRAVLTEKILSVTGVEQPAPSIPESQRVAPEKQPVLAPGEYDALVIGASTGGPPAIEQVLRDIGGFLPVPVGIVQHMPEGFTRAFAERLNANLAVRVKEAGHGERFQAGQVFIAPAGSHMRLRQEDSEVRVVLTRYPEDIPHRPSVDVLFQSAAEIFQERCVAVLLTGMGNDGAHGMAELARHGAYTMAQNEASCVVYGMPRAAVEMGAARETISLARIGSRLKELILEPQKHSVESGP